MRLQLAPDVSDHPSSAERQVDIFENILRDLESDLMKREDGRLEFDESQRQEYWYLD